MGVRSDNMFAVVGQPMLETTDNIYETIESYTLEIERDLLRNTYNDERTSKPTATTTGDRHRTVGILRHPKDTRHHRDHDARQQNNNNVHFQEDNASSRTSTVALLGHARDSRRQLCADPVSIRDMNTVGPLHRRQLTIQGRLPVVACKPQPIVIYEEPDHPSQLLIREGEDSGDGGAGYVFAYRGGAAGETEPTDYDDTYETIGSTIESDVEYDKLMMEQQQLLFSSNSGSSLEGQQQQLSGGGVGSNMAVATALMMARHHPHHHHHKNFTSRKDLVPLVPQMRAPLRDLRTANHQTKGHQQQQQWVAIKDKKNADQFLSSGAQKQRISPGGPYHDRMEAVAQKVSRLHGRGQLKLSVYVNCGLLTIHVVQARQLGSKTSLNCNAYVKLSLAPDDIKRTRCKTDVVHETNKPVFDEKFSFELLEEDVKKRLLISVWNKDDTTDRRSEFLGCMSFGINHIRSSNRTVNGWYYLLTEEVGRRKHLRVVDRKSLQQQQGDPSGHNKNQHHHIQNNNYINMSPSGNNSEDLQYMDRHVIVVKRGEAGYGFTVSGSAPPQVCRIEQGSLAETAGLQKNDCIVRINGQNVSRSGSDNVARIVRHAQKQVVLEVQRSRVTNLGSGDNNHDNKTLPLASPWKPTMCSTFLPSPTASEKSEPEVNDDDDYDSVRSLSPPPLRLEDLDEDVPRHLSESFSASTGSASSGSGSDPPSGGRYYRESLV